MGCNCVRAVEKEKAPAADHQDHGYGPYGGLFTYAKGCVDWADEMKLKIGNRQSPIDIPTDKVISAPEELPISMKISFSKSQVPLSVDYTPTGFAVKHQTDPLGEIHLESLKEKEGSVYVSKSFHFHSKSEHKFDGVQYDSEMHIMFMKKAQLENPGESVMEDNFAVVGILFAGDDQNAHENNDKLIATFTPESPQSAVVVEMNDLLKRILNQDLEFYHYKGSLTSPPCTESVSWFVYPKVLPVKKDILKAFHSKWVDNKEFNATGAGNSRPVCELNDRKIFKIKPVIE